MLSTWKDLAVFLDATAEGERIGRHAAAVAGRHGAHLVGVYGVSREDGRAAEAYARGEQAIADVIERRRQADEQKVVAAGRHFAEFSHALGVSAEFRVVWRDSAVDTAAALRTLHCDLVVAGHPRPRDLPDDWSAERLLFATGMPVLIVPAAWSGEALGDRVVIAWNGSREARRAVADAMPFLAAAERVTVLVVDADRTPERFGAEPGADLARYLERHGVRVDVARVESHGARVGEVIQAEAAARGASLVVIGAYSRPRTAELLFGGVTRHLLADAQLPLLVAR